MELPPIEPHSVSISWDGSPGMVARRHHLVLGYEQRGRARSFTTGMVFLLLVFLVSFWLGVIANIPARHASLYDI